MTKPVWQFVKRSQKHTRASWSDIAVAESTSGDVTGISSVEIGRFQHTLHTLPQARTHAQENLCAAPAQFDSTASMAIASERATQDE